MLESLYKDVKLKGKLAWRREEDRKYMMSLTTENLLLPFYHEAGIIRITYLPKNLHGGWDSPLSMIRGTVCGHWLSTAALLYSETKDAVVKGRADEIVREIGRCQEENGGEWCFPIPEEYLVRRKRGKRAWAPQYVCREVMACVVVMSLRTGVVPELAIVQLAAEWFLLHSEVISGDQLRQLL